jgi:putative membrane protein
MRYGSYGDGGIGWGGWVAMVMMMVVFWGAIAWVIVTLVRHNGPRTDQPRPSGSDPVEILDQRFARGEIDDEEYQRRRAILRDGR